MLDRKDEKIIIRSRKLKNKRSFEKDKRSATNTGKKCIFELYQN